VEIHKPKPIHSWREFLSEVGVIVLGICIALAGEQAIEWLHWQGEVKTARQAIHAEIAADEANPIARHLAFQPCLDRQLREAEAILTNLEAHRPPGRFTSFHSGFGGPGVTAEWDAQRAAQTLVHFPPEEVAMMGRVYDTMSVSAAGTTRKQTTGGTWRCCVIHPPVLCQGTWRGCTEASLFSGAPAA
jgi:hypothetical protein